MEKKKNIFCTIILKNIFLKCFAKKVNEKLKWKKMKTLQNFWNKNRMPHDLWTCFATKNTSLSTYNVDSDSFWLNKAVISYIFDNWLFLDDKQNNHRLNAQTIFHEQNVLKCKLIQTHINNLIW